MWYLFILLFFASISAALAQNKSSKTTVFKVRAPASVCSIFLEDTCLWLEKNNKIRVVVRSKCEKIKVVFSSGKIIAQDGDDYTVNFNSGGRTVISVYEIKNKRSKLIHTESFKVREPVLYFCGAKVSSFKHSLYVRGENFKAYSIPFDTTLPVIGFDMNYNNGVNNKIYHGKDNKLTEEMLDILFKDSQPSMKKTVNRGIYFSNILASMPDGSKKTLSPFAISVVRDSSNMDNIVFNFAVLKMTLKK